MYLLVTKQLLTMMFIVLGGFIFAKAFKVKDAEQKFISKMLLYLINPCLVFSSFNKEFDSLKLKQLLVVMLISVVLFAITILFSTALTLSKDPSRKDYISINRLSNVFTNCGFIGIPLIRGVFGDDGVFYLMGYLVIFNIALWTYGYYQMCHVFNFKKIITNPNIIAILLGLIVFCLPIKLPEFIAKPVAMIGDLNTATAMILIGILFANFKLPAQNSSKNTTSDQVQVPVLSKNKYIFMLVKTIIIRLVLCSFLSLAVLFGIYKIFTALNLNPGILGTLTDIRLFIFVIYICSLCPSATSVPSMAVLFEKDATYASLMVSLTSLFCMITVPAFVALGELIIK